MTFILIFYLVNNPLIFFVISQTFFMSLSLVEELVLIQCWIQATTYWPPPRTNAGPSRISGPDDSSQKLTIRWVGTSRDFCSIDFWIRNEKGVTIQKKTCFNVDRSSYRAAALPWRAPSSTPTVCWWARGRPTPTSRSGTSRRAPTWPTFPAIPARFRPSASPRTDTIWPPRQVASWNFHKYGNF